MEFPFSKDPLRLIVYGATEQAAAYRSEIEDFVADWLCDSPTITLRSSGSTGQPKCIDAPKSEMLDSAHRTIDYFNLRPDSSALLSLDMDYIAAKMMIVRAVTVGMTLHATPPTSDPFRHLPTDLDLDFAPLTPLQLNTIFQCQNSHAKIRRLRTILLGGSAVTPRLEDIIHKEPNAYYLGYGMTETYSHIALRRLNGADRSPFYHPLRGVKVDRNTNGCAVISLGFEKTLLTNDYIELGESGDFLVCGRCDNVIITGGVKVQIEEIEALIGRYVSHPFAIAATPDERLGEMVTLVCEPPVSAADLPRELIEKINPHHRPRRFISLPLPRLASGKIDRLALKRLLSETPEPEKSDNDGIWSC